MRFLPNFVYIYKKLCNFVIFVIFGSRQSFYYCGSRRKMKRRQIPTIIRSQILSPQKKEYLTKKEKKVLETWLIWSVLSICRDTIFSRSKLFIVWGQRTTTKICTKNDVLGEKEKDTDKVCVCVCEREKERGREKEKVINTHPEQTNIYE